LNKLGYYVQSYVLGSSFHYFGFGIPSHLIIDLVINLFLLFYCCHLIYIFLVSNFLREGVTQIKGTHICRNPGITCNHVGVMMLSCVCMVLSYALVMVVTFLGTPGG
jgi:hypothetical protein